jgi:hypothetical protein
MALRVFWIFFTVLCEGIAGQCVLSEIHVECIETKILSNLSEAIFLC